MDDIKKALLMKKRYCGGNAIREMMNVNKSIKHPTYRNYRYITSCLVDCGMWLKDYKESKRLLQELRTIENHRLTIQAMGTIFMSVYKRSKKCPT